MTKFLRPQFRKKPVVIEAVRLVGFEESSFEPLFASGPDEPGHRIDHYSQPVWLSEAAASNHITLTSAGPSKSDPFGQRPVVAIRTPEGAMTASPGDWIIQGVKGELYPCKPDIFAATYDPVTEETPAMPDETFLDRLQAERDELAARTEKLGAFIGTPAFEKIDDYQRNLLPVQLAAMETYFHILDFRLSLLNGTAPKDGDEQPDEFVRDQPAVSVGEAEVHN